MSLLKQLTVDPSNITIRTKLYDGPLYTLSIAINSETNEKLFVNKPSKGSERSTSDGFYSFAQKIQCLNCPFLMTISGISAKKPYFYLTQYAERGSLRSVLRVQRSLTGAQKTIFAISIANCLLYLHHRKVNIPSLTTDIIYITGKGTAKINITEIDQRGLPPWHAPEIDEIEDSSTKSDIFLFAFVLYEMLAGETPFFGKGSDEIMENIRSRKRPSVSRFTSSKPLVELIQKCWSHNPDNRPTIETVVKTLECTKVVFPETDEEEVGSFIRKLEGHRRKKTSAPSSPTKQSASMGSFNRSGFAKPYLSVFSDYQSDDFVDSLNDIQDILKEEDIVSFYILVSHHFRHGVPVNIQRDVIRAINTTLLVYFCFEALQQANILKLLPYDEDMLFDDVFDLLHTVFLYGQPIINADFSRTLNLLTKKSPEKSIILYANYLKQYDTISNAAPVINCLLDNQKAFYRSKVGNEYISTLFFLCFNSEAFFKKYMQHCRPIFCTFMHSEDPTAAKTAYYAVFTLLDSEFQLPFQQIISDVCDVDLSQSAVSVLLKLTSFPMPQQLIDNLLEIVDDRNDAFLLLLRIADVQQGAKNIINNTSWLLESSLKIVDKLKLFMVILKHLKLRERVSSLEEIPQFLTNLAKSNNVQVRICLGVTIRKLLITKSTLDELTEKGFFNALLAAINEKENDTVVGLLIEVIASLAKNGYTKSYKMFIEPLVSCLEDSDKVCKSAFTALIYLSFHDKCAEKIKNTNIKSLLKRIPKDLIPTEQKETLLSNLQ